MKKTPIHKPKQNPLDFLNTLKSISVNLPTQGQSVNLPKGSPVGLTNQPPKKKKGK